MFAWWSRVRRSTCKCFVFEIHFTKNYSCHFESNHRCRLIQSNFFFRTSKVVHVDSIKQINNRMITFNESWHISSWRRQTWSIYACKSIDRLNIDFFSRLIQKSRILCKSTRFMSESNAITFNFINFRETMTIAFSSSLFEIWISSSRKRLFVIEITFINVCAALSNATVTMKCLFAIWDFLFWFCENVACFDLSCVENIWYESTRSISKYCKQ